MSDATAVDRPSVLQVLVGVRRDERAMLALSALYFFLVMASYFILRPIRDQMGVAGGVRNLAWLFTGTLVAMLLVSPLFSALVSRWPRRRFVTWSYRALMLCLLAFYGALVGLPEATSVWVGRAFFIWVSVFNLFAVSLFWAVMADVYQGESSRRLYGVIAAGGSLGALLGGVVTAGLVELIGAPALLLVSLVDAGTGAVVHVRDQRPRRRGVAGVRRRTPSRRRDHRRQRRRRLPPGRCARPTCWASAATCSCTRSARPSCISCRRRSSMRPSTAEAAQTVYFANVDIWVNGLTLVLQLLLTGRLMARIGVGLTLAALPLVSVIGFVGLGLYPVLAAVVVFTVARRVTNFALSRPAREALYVPLSRAEKYKAKNLIDTVVYRVGDQVGAWTNTLLLWLGLGIGGIALTAAPLAAVWLLLSLWLGRRYSGRAGHQAAAGSPATP